MLTKDEIIAKILSKYEGLFVNENWWETWLFYNPEHKLKKGIYLLTFKEKDGKNDSSSDLNREKFYRLNLGISKETFTKLFGSIPSRPKAGEVISMSHNFSQTDTIIPHPVYGWMAWICVINPSQETFNTLLPLIEEGYKLAIGKYQKK